jgi:heavy metal sensor kinase
MPPGEEDLLWVQLWTEDGRQLLVQSYEAMRRPLPEASRLAMGMPGDRIVSVPADPVPMRVLTLSGGIRDTPVVLQVARSEGAMSRDLGELVLVLVGGLPLAVLVGAFGAYWLARHALAPVELMAERARLITAERLGERLPVANPDDEMGRLATVFNETLSRLEASFEAMRRFTADVSHELRTPLTAIRSVGEVGLRGHRDEIAYRTIVGSMLEEADRLATLVDRLLALSRAETGQAQVVKREIDLKRLVDEAVAQLAVLAEEKGQSLVVTHHDGASVHADPFVLRQAVLNLVDNAIKFTPAGGRIDIRTSDSAREVIIDVSDTGGGIPPDAAAHIFDRFYRVDDGETHGAGLGLSIAKGAVEANGGRLALLTTGPSGSTFRITLPHASEGHERRRAG